MGGTATRSAETRHDSHLLQRTQDVSDRHRALNDLSVTETSHIDRREAHAPVRRWYPEERTLLSTFDAEDAHDHIRRTNRGSAAAGDRSGSYCVTVRAALKPMYMALTSGYCGRLIAQVR